VPVPFPADRSAPARPRPTRSFGILSTFPPTACGIATFSAALAAGLTAGGDSVDVVRVGPGPVGLEDAVVRGFLPATGAPDDALEVLDQTDVAIIQHEFGIYPGDDGAGLLPVMAGLNVPSVVVAHTVPERPSAGQRRVLTAVCEAATAVVVMTAHGRVGLIERFGIDPDKVHAIAHGAATPAAGGTPRRLHERPRVLTWGLLGPGKGIEWAIEAFAELADMRPRPQYVVAGATHPKVKELDGEQYRNMLVKRAWAAGVAPHVHFDDAYRDLPALTELIVSADLVVLPYDSEDQVTSGVLVDAVAAGRPVVSTAFPHAVELLASGAGIVVPQRDPKALAAAIREVLADRSLREEMAAEARRLAPALSWAAVASDYADLADALLAGRSTAVR